MDPHEQREQIKEAEHFVDVISHFENYATHCFQRYHRIKTDVSMLDPAHRALLPGLEKKYSDIHQSVAVNQRFIREITNCQQAFMAPFVHYGALYDRPWRHKEERQSKVRTTLRQCVRDWSAEGQKERAQCYGPLLEALAKRFPTPASRRGKRVIVPGSGLGRLVWETSHLGFDAQGNEFSYYMLLCSYLILNGGGGKNAYTMHPFIYETKNLLNFKNQNRAITIPDVDPAHLPEGSGFSMVAGDFLEVFNNQMGEIDALLTCFFLDTANNVLKYIETISKLLKVGGYWMNFGPLLYHFAEMHDELSVELNYEEIKSTFGAFGLELEEEKTHMPANYTESIDGMLAQMYSCVFFVVKKVREPSVVTPSRRDIPLGRTGFMSRPLPQQQQQQQQPVQQESSKESKSHNPKNRNNSGKNQKGGGSNSNASPRSPAMEDEEEPKAETASKRRRQRKAKK